MLATGMFVMQTNSVVRSGGASQSNILHCGHLEEAGAGTAVPQLLNADDATLPCLFMVSIIEIHRIEVTRPCFSRAARK